MTLWVNRDGQNVTIHGNNGLGVKIQDSRVQEFTVSEHYMHLRSFWSSLGDRLREAEAEAEAARQEAEV